MERHLNKRTLAVVTVAAVLAACTDSTGTGGTSLSITEKLALTTAITSSGALAGAGAAAGFAPIAITLLGSVGSLSAGTSASAQIVANAINASVRGTRSATYEGAIGVQVILTTGSTSATWTGVVGWDGLNATASTVDALVTAGAVTATSTPVAAVSTTAIGSAGGTASYWVRSGNANYLGTSGSFDLMSFSFSGGGVDCTALATQVGFPVTSCNYIAGTMTGSFVFGASKTSGTGATTYDQPMVNFSALPALKITIVD